MLALVGWGIDRMVSEKQRASKRASQARHSEAHAKKNAVWRAANKDKTDGYHRKWKVANPEKIRAMKNAWNAKHPEKARARVKAWIQANPERVKAYRV